MFGALAVCCSLWITKWLGGSWGSPHLSRTVSVFILTETSQRSLRHSAGPGIHLWLRTGFCRCFPVESCQELVRIRQRSWHKDVNRRELLGDRMSFQICRWNVYSEITQWWEQQKNSGCAVQAEHWKMHSKWWEVIYTPGAQRENQGGQWAACWIPSREISRS